MPTITTIQFTQDQMRTVTGVSIETVRHWRKIVPYLATKAGKAARFSFADLLGLAVTNELVGSLGVHIGSVSAGVDKLFELLTAANAPALEGAIAYITSTSASLQESSSWNTTTRALKQPALVIPLDPLIAQLQQHMLPMMPAPTQTALPFPPEAVRAERERYDSRASSGGDWIPTGWTTCAWPSTWDRCAGFPSRSRLHA